MIPAWQVYKDCKSAVDQVSEYSMTSGTRLAHTFYTIKELDKQNIEGDIVECGVWKGGQIIISWLANTNTQRNFWLYDTFEGMTTPTDADFKINKDGTKGYAKDSGKSKNGFDQWCRAEVEEVEENLNKFMIPQAKRNFIKGDVCKTLDDTSNLPNKIAFLRLDTDWYESTLKELQVLWPRVVKGGYMVLDDYLSGKGSKRAVHEVFGPSVNISIIDEKAVVIKKD